MGHCSWSSHMAGSISAEGVYVISSLIFLKSSFFMQYKYEVFFLKLTINKQ